MDAHLAPPPADETPPQYLSVTPAEPARPRTLPPLNVAAHSFSSGSRTPRQPASSSAVASATTNFDTISTTSILHPKHTEHISSLSATRTGHGYPIATKASDILFGKKSDKVHDLLGCTQQELTMFKPKQKAHLLLGVSAHATQSRDSRSYEVDESGNATGRLRARSKTYDQPPAEEEQPTADNNFDVTGYLHHLYKDAVMVLTTKIMCSGS